MDKTKLSDKIFNGATALCFIFGGVIWGTHSVQNTAEHKAFMSRLETVEVRVSQHDIDLAILKYKSSDEAIRGQ